MGKEPHQVTMSVFKRDLLLTTRFSSHRISISYETSWELVDSSGGTIDSGEGFDNDETIDKAMCVDKNECYTLTIKDDFGDG
jgi:hypothetical protein